MGLRSRNKVAVPEGAAGSLLSREPIFVEQFSMACHGVPEFVFSPSLHVFTAHGGWWVWSARWVGHKVLWQTSTHCGSRSTPCERPLPCVVVVAPRSRLAAFVVGVGVCGGLFMICIVVEHICSVLFLCFV